MLYGNSIFDKRNSVRSRSKGLWKFNFQTQTVARFAHQRNWDFGHLLLVFEELMENASILQQVPQGILILGKLFRHPRCHISTHTACSGWVRGIPSFSLEDLDMNWIISFSVLIRTERSLVDLETKRFSKNSCRPHVEKPIERRQELLMWIKFIMGVLLGFWQM